MNIEDAKNNLKIEREAYWAHLTDPILKKSKRRVQNRINQYVSRWNKFFYLETANDYNILACELKEMREGRPKRREGRPRRPEERSKRRTSQRLADRRRKPDTVASEEDSLFDSAIDLDFDRLDDAPPSEEDVNISAETTTSHSSATSSSEEFTHNLSKEINRSPDRISSNLFELCNSQALSQYSDIPPLDETWCHSNDMNDTASISGMLNSATNLAGDKWIESLQHDVDFAWQDLANFNGPHVLSGNGENWSESNILAPGSHRTVVQSVIHDPIKSASENINGVVETQLSGAPLPPEEVDNGMQAKVFDQAQMRIIMTELESQLYKRRRHRQNRENKPVPARRPQHAERDDLAPLIEQCLTTLRGLRHMKDRTELKTY